MKTTKKSRTSKQILTFKAYHGTRQGGRWSKYVDGKVHYFGTAKSEKDVAARKKAEQAFFAYMAGEQKSKPQTIKVSRVTVADAVEGYLQHQKTRNKQGDIADGYVNDCIVAINCWLLPFMGGKKNLNAVINELQLQQYHDYLISGAISKSTKRPLSVCNKIN